ncbi:MAG: cyclase family protein [Acidaminobacteraceae bacterium]
MNIYDVSMKISDEMMVYKNRDEKRIKLTNTKNHSKDGIYESRLDMDLHTGTHIDAPLHILENGEKIENMMLSKLITKCKVLDFTYVKESISKDELKTKNIVEGDFILLKTKNSLTDDFNKDFVYLDKVGAKYLAKLNIKGVGIDALGIERSQAGHETHKFLMNNDIYIIEGLRLEYINEDEYVLIALPLKIENAEASPCRAVLMDGDIDKIKIKAKDSIEKLKNDSKCKC